MAKTKRVKFDASAKASSSKAQFIPLRPIQSVRRARTFTSIPSSAQRRLHSLDSRRCLITLEEVPRSSLQATHIVAHRTAGNRVERLEAMWNMTALNLDSIGNLVTLRSDWHLSYDHKDWALVPTLKILDKIIACSNSSFAKPYNGYDNSVLHDYIFVPLPTLRRRYIIRDDEDEKVKDDQEDDQDTDKDAEEEEADEGFQDADDHEDEEAVLDMGGKASIYRRLFSQFPILRHHAHPFFVIYNALPKLALHSDSLSEDQLVLYERVNAINQRWLARRVKGASIPKPRPRQKRDGNPPDDDDPGDNTRRRSRSDTRKNADVAASGKTQTPSVTRAATEKGKGRQEQLDGASTSSDPQKRRRHDGTPSADDDEPNHGPRREWGKIDRQNGREGSRKVQTRSVARAAGGGKGKQRREQLMGEFISSDGRKRRRYDGAPLADDNEPDDGPIRKLRRTDGRVNPKVPGSRKSQTNSADRRIVVGRGKGGRVNGNADNHVIQLSYPTPPPTSQFPTTHAKCAETFHFEDFANVSAWVSAVAAAGTPDVINETVIWSDKELVRPAVQNWDCWHIPYKQPRRRSEFCSSD